MLMTPNPAAIKPWVDLITGVLTLLGGILAATWAYTKFVVERGLLAPSQFSIDCTVVGQQKDIKILEIILRLKNVGTSTLIVGNIRIDVRGLNENDGPKLFDDPGKPTFGRVVFPHVLLPSAPTGISPKGKHKDRGVCLLLYDTFVQAGVEQLYTFVTAVPSSNAFVLVWSSFEYAQHPSVFQSAALLLSRWFGLIQYSLGHVTKPHTAERVFRT
jgi:hypothetical protein